MAFLFTKRSLFVVYLALLGVSLFWIVGELSSNHSAVTPPSMESTPTPQYVSLTKSKDTYCRMPPVPDPRLIEQPNGSSFEAYILLLSNVAYLETTDGFTIMKDPQDGFYKYASRGIDGDLAISTVRVSAIGQRSPEEQSLLQAISMHLRFTGMKLAELENNYQFRKNDNGNIISAIFPPAGVQRTLLLLIDFPDQPATYTTNDFDNFANQTGYSVNGASGSVREYYEAISYGLLTLNTDVSGWYTAANNRAAYGVAINYNVAADLVREAVDAAESAGVDFSQYDGDGDGRVDVVEVIHSGRGAEESGNFDDVWSHRSSLSNTNQSVTYDGVLIADFIILAEKYGSAQIANIGVFVHEFGHALGLPDLYDTDGGSTGIGDWCCMSFGALNRQGRTPAHFSAWCKAELGWITPTVIASDAEGSVSNLAASAFSDEAYRINTNNPEEYFLLENRQQTDWDSDIPGEGLMIYHINEDEDRNNNENNPLVGVEQADGNGSISNLSNNGDIGDPFPGSTNNSEFNCNTSPNSRTYDLGFTNVNIFNISTSNNLIDFEYGNCIPACSIQDIEIDPFFRLDNTYDNFTYDYRCIVTYEFPPMSGTLDVTVAGVTLNEAITGSPQTVSFTGLPGDGASVSPSASFSADPSCSLTKFDLYLAPIYCMNDDFCDALDITNDIDSDPIRCSNVNATVQDNEPKPKRRQDDCSGLDSWCSSFLLKTVWFKFTAPASGSIDIDFLTDIDMRIAIWETNSDCSAISDPNECLLVAANDRGDSSSGLFSPRIENLRCLVPGKEYYLQMGGSRGSFTFKITDPGLTCAVAPTASAGCGNSFSANSNGYGTWRHLIDGDGHLFASVNDQFNELGSIDASYHLNSSSIRMDGVDYPLLDRDWLINVANNNNAAIRLYFTESEYQNLIAAGAPSSLDEWTLLKLSNGSCSNYTDGTSSILNPSDSKMFFDNNQHMLEFRINDFSSFFPRSNAAILPVDLQYFRGHLAGKINLLEWASSMEENTIIHEIERLIDQGDDWQTIGQLSAAGSSRSLITYQWEDHFPLPLAYYRIKTIDFDGSYQYSDIVSLKRDNVDYQVSKGYPNPTTSLFNTAVYITKTANMHYTLVGSSGQILLQEQKTASTGLTHLEIDLSNYPQGIYFLKIQIGEQQFLQKVLKK